MSNLPGNAASLLNHTGAPLTSGITGEEGREEGTGGEEGGGRSENRKGDGARQNTEEKKKTTAHAPGRCGAPGRGPLGPPGPRAGPPRGPAVGGNPECSSQAPGREPGKASGGPFSRRVPASGPGRGPDRRGRGPLVPGRTRPSPREGPNERNIPATERKTPQTGLKNRNRNPPTPETGKTKNRPAAGRRLGGGCRRRPLAAPAAGGPGEPRHPDAPGKSFAPPAIGTAAPPLL